MTSPSLPQPPGGSGTPGPSGTFAPGGGGAQPNPQVMQRIHRLNSIVEAVRNVAAADPSLAEECYQINVIVQKMSMKSVQSQAPSEGPAPPV